MARLRLETPARIGIARRASARASSSSLRPVSLACRRRGSRAAAARRGRQVLALGVDRDQRPVACDEPVSADGVARLSRYPRQTRHRGHRQGEVQAGGGADGVGVPGIVAIPWSACPPRRQRRRRARRRPCCPSCAGPRAGRPAAAAGRRAARRVDVGPPGERDDAGARRLRRELGDRLGDTAPSARPASRQVRRQLGRQLHQLRQAVTATASSTSAPKRSACLSAWKPSSTASSRSRRAPR